MSLAGRIIFYILISIETYYRRITCNHSFQAFSAETIIVWKIYGILGDRKAQ